VKPLQPDDPESIGGYELLGRLGVGGMEQVFLGRSAGGRRVAVKVIRPEHVGTGEFRKRFAREVAAARRVGGFHTAPVVDADPEADPPWMVTANILGPSLQDQVAKSGPLAPDEVRALGAGLAEGLDTIHRCGLVHRDLKPGNVLLAGDGPRIIDFGIARTADASLLTASGAVVGTFAYMSPEQSSGDVPGPESDVFSLGSVLAFAAAGRPPFGSGSVATIVRRIVGGQADLSAVPETGGLRDLVAACLSTDPAARPSVADLLVRLGETPATEPGGAAPLTSPGSPAGYLTRRRVVGAVAAGGLAAAATTVGIVRAAGHGGSSPNPARTSSRPAAPPTTVRVPATPGGLAGGSGRLVSLAFSPDGKTVAAVSEFEEAVRLWEVASGRRVAVIKAPTTLIGSVAFSPDGRTLATAQLDPILWDPTAGRRIATLPVRRGFEVDHHAKFVAFGPDGRTLVTAGSGADDAPDVVWFWDVPSRRHVATITVGKQYTMEWRR
jgi:hypothetical protein